MQDILVVFDSKYGWTRQYAAWLGEDLRADVVERTAANREILEKYSKVVYGGGLYLGRIRGLRQVRARLARPFAAVFAVGLALITQESTEQVRAANGVGYIPFFLLRGGMDMNALTWLDRRLMGGLRHMLRRKATLTESERELLGIWEHAADFADKATLAPLVALLEERTSSK